MHQQGEGGRGAKKQLHPRIDRGALNTQMGRGAGGETDSLIARWDFFLEGGKNNEGALCW